MRNITIQRTAKLERKYPEILISNEVSASFKHYGVLPHKICIKYHKFLYLHNNNNNIAI